MITQIELDGFKTFKDFKVELAPFQVIVGPNGAGKSNLFDALQLLSRLAEVDVQTAFQELRPDPKTILNKIVAKAESERRRKMNRRTFYESLALEIKLERLRQVPAYQKFVAELTEVLEKLNIIPRIKQW